MSRNFVKHAINLWKYDELWYTIMVITVFIGKGYN